MSPNIDLRKDLELADGTTQSWQPEPDEILIGPILTINETTGEYGPQKVAQILDEETEAILTVWLTRTVLKNQFDLLKPEPGDRIGIKYHGEVEGANGRSYHNYTVRLDRARNQNQNQIQLSKSKSKREKQQEQEQAFEQMEEEVPF